MSQEADVNSSDTAGAAVRDHDCVESYSCSGIGHRVYCISVPVSVKPFAKVDEPKIKCLGDIQIYPGIICHDCKFVSEFTIVQRISVDVPLQYGVITCYHDECIEDDLIKEN